MATSKQKKIARLIIENEKLDKPLNGGEMLAKVGYAKSMHRAKVNDVLESDGVREELNNLGFNEDAAKKVVSDILLNEKNDPNSRLKAADQIFKVFGTYAAEKKQTLNVNLDVETTPSEVTDIREKYEAELKARLISNETE